MTYGKRTIQILGAISLILFVNSVAQAGIIDITSPFTNNDTGNWGNLAVNDLGQCVGVVSGCTPPAVNMLNTTGNTVTVSFGDASLNGIVYLENNNGSDTYNGGFNSGDYLLNTNDTQAPSTADSITLTFLHPISAFGLYVEEFDGINNAFTATVTTPNNDGNGGGSDTSTSNTGAQWIGLGDSGGNATISSVTITTSGPVSGYFLIDSADFTDGNTTITSPPVTTPEPASMLMMAGGIAALVFKARKRARA